MFSVIDIIATTRSYMPNNYIIATTTSIFYLSCNK